MNAACKKLKTVTHVFTSYSASRLRFQANQIAAFSLYLRALLWFRFARLWSYIRQLTSRHRALVLLAIFLSLVGVSAYSIAALQAILQSYFSETFDIGDLRSLYLAVGASLVGAAAIAFSLVMFSMQVNVERMPHGLFRKFTSDQSLLGAFAGIFLLAIGISCLSIVTSIDSLSVSMLAAIWGIVAIWLLFLHSYGRALLLINPLEQLRLVFEDTSYQLRVWDRRARRAAPLLKSAATIDPDHGGLKAPNHDVSRIVYFRMNPHWTASAQQAIAHTTSVSRRYAEQGDHEVAGAALTTIVGINAAYIAAKGKTFFTQHFMIDNPLTTDGFINETLEHLRKIIQTAVARGDELQIEQAFKAMSQLVHVYIQIDYSDEQAQKIHAMVASGYLSNAVLSVVPRDMPDVLMEGLRYLGEVASVFLEDGRPNDITSIIDKIAIVASAGAVRESHRPVTIIGMEQLASVTVKLMHLSTGDIQYAARNIRSNISLIARVMLAIPDTAMTNIHGSCLAPYYSPTSQQSVASQLTDMANAISEAEANSERAKGLIANLEEWADGVYESQKELFLAAIAKRSHFTFDVVHWNTHITKLLLAVSNAPACTDRMRDDLRSHALWLISVFSWAPDDRESVGFVETFQLTDQLFEAALDAHTRGCGDIAARIAEMLLTWTFKAGTAGTGWAIFERGLTALALLSLAQEGDRARASLCAKVSAQLVGEIAPTQELRDDAARGLRRRAATLGRRGYGFSAVESAIEAADQEKLLHLFEDFANLLSPGTSDEPVERWP